MDYRRFDDYIVVRMDKGDGVVRSLAKVLEKEEVQLAKISGIGATDNVRIGFFDEKSKNYNVRRYTDSFEITSVTGNASRKDGEVYTHLHINLASKDNKVIGGHLDACIISVTGEFIIEVIKGDANRTMSEEIGINLIDFD